MSLRYIHARVRPVRVAVVVGRHASPDQMLAAVTFLGSLWGGRHSLLIPGNEDGEDDHAIALLSRARPDFIYGIGVDDASWARATHRACQPRQYAPLPPLSHSIPRFQRGEQFILGLASLSATYEQRERRPSDSANITLVSAEGDSASQTLFAAQFGKHPAGLLPQRRDHHVTATPATDSALVSLATRLITSRDCTWLDVASNFLSVSSLRSTFTTQPSPTVVLARNIIDDVSLLWNLRSQWSAASCPPFVIINVASLWDASQVALLRGWIFAAAQGGDASLVCDITSASISAHECLECIGSLSRDYADRELINYRYAAPYHLFDTTPPSAQEETCVAEYSKRKLTFLPPRPSVLRASTKGWVVDLLRDKNTGRAVAELQLPPHECTLDLLNGPTPPAVSWSLIPTFANGPESVAAFVQNGSHAITLFCPTSNEVIEELFHSAGYAPERDEKRIVYEAAFRLFGGLLNAREALVGDAGKVFFVLADLGGEKAVRQDPKPLKTIKQLIGQGKGGLPGKPYADFVSECSLLSSDRQRRIGKRRFAKYLDRRVPSDQRLVSLLELWAQKGVLRRSLRVGCCRRCNRDRYASRIPPQKELRCRWCHGSVALREQGELAYALTPSMFRAVTEGFIPVALTGALLRRSTTHGFLWVPGTKFRQPCGTQGDCDFVAICDGTIVVGECKFMHESDEHDDAWEECVRQYEAVVELGASLSASVAVFAVCADQIPSQHSARIAEIAAAAGLTALVLTKRHLEDGGVMGENGLPLLFSELITALPSAEKTTAASGI